MILHDRIENSGRRRFRNDFYGQRDQEHSMLFS
jgi:hypothetical protein